MISPIEKRAKELRGYISDIGSPKKPVNLPRYIPSSTSSTIGEADLMRLKREILDEINAKEATEIDDELVNAVVDKIRKDKSLDVSDIRNFQSFVYQGTKYGVHEMMHGGSGTASSTTAVYNEVVAGSGTSFTLAHSPTSGSVALYGNGQRLTSGAGNDYTISGATITTTNSFSAGDLLADYTY